MAELDYVAPATVGAAVEALGTDGAVLMGGGTDLLVQIRSGRAAPSRIVDLKRIPGLVGVRRDEAGYAIGAATPGAMISEHTELSRDWPGVVEAVGLIGSTQIQARASIGGNLCNASPAADSVPALIAARAVCIIAGPNGQREAPVEAVTTGPGRTSLAPGEFLLEIRLPARAPRSSDAYLRMIPRTEMDIAVVGAGVNLTLDADGVCTQAQVALGAVAPTVLRVEAAGAALIGSKLEEGALERLSQACEAACNPISDKRGTAEYRTRTAGVLARRAAAIAYDRARERT